MSHVLATPHLLCHNLQMLDSTCAVVRSLNTWYVVRNITLWNAGLHTAAMPSLFFTFWTSVAFWSCDIRWSDSWRFQIWFSSIHVFVFSWKFQWLTSWFLDRHYVYVFELVTICNVAYTWPLSVNNTFYYILHISCFSRLVATRGPLVPLCVYNGMVSYMFAGTHFGSPLLASWRRCRCMMSKTYGEGDGDVSGAKCACTFHDHASSRAQHAPLALKETQTASCVALKKTTRIMCSCVHVSFIICIGNSSFHILRHIHIANLYLYCCFDMFLQHRVSSMRLQLFPSCNVMVALSMFDCVVHCWRWRKRWPSPREQELPKSAMYQRFLNNCLNTLSSL
jgi:hypothetical protein